MAHLPDFFICGAAKSGTTSLWKYLQQHPSLFLPASVKEPGYFSSLRPMDDADRYAALFEEASPDQRVGEASGAYLTSPESAARIRDAVPDAQIIIMLRNPADRAYSLYRWMTREGYEYVPTFERALAVEQERLDDPSFKHENPEYYYNFLYVTSGLYSTQVKRFLDTFPSDQILFVLFDEFIREPAQVTKRVFRFLEVDDAHDPAIAVYNKGKDVWSPHLQFLLRHRLGRAFEKLLGSRGVRLRDWLMRLNVSQAPRSLPREMRSDLLARYEDDIKETEALTGLALSDTWLS